MASKPCNALIQQTHQVYNTKISRAPIGFDCHKDHYYVKEKTGLVGILTFRDSISIPRVNCSH